MQQYDVSVNHDGVRREELEGREHLVVPANAVEEGVLDGGFISAASIEQSEPGWNGVPVTAGHPTDGGRFISANQPQVDSNLTYGTFYDAEAEDGAMAGELWLDVERAAELAEDGFDKPKRAIEKLEDGEDIAVSTSYIPKERREDAGEYDGTSYQHVIEDFHPDHIATIVDGQGRDPNARTQVANALSSIESRVGEVLANVKDDGEDDSPEVSDDLAESVETLANSVESVADAVESIDERVSTLEGEVAANSDSDAGTGEDATDFSGRLGGKDESSEQEPKPSFGSYNHRRNADD
jgi:gas vesicle protein